MLANDLHKALTVLQKTIALAESCTGGALAASLTAIPGASKIFLGSVVAYSNAWKESFLGVPDAILQKYGAVSHETVQAMAEGLFKKTQADFVAAVTGTLGPSIAPGDPPIGTVFIATGKRGHAISVKKIHVSTGRPEAIERIVQMILSDLLNLVSS